MAATASHLRFLGHSTCLLALDGLRVVTDPVLGDWLGPLRRHALSVKHALEDVDVDVVLVSHAHRDHLDLRSLRRVPGRPAVVVPAGLGATLAARGHDVVEVAPGECVRVRDLAIDALPALHAARRGPFGRAIPALSYRIAASTRVYFAGDTDLDPRMADLAGGVDVALLPVWGWGPRLGAGHLDPRRAAEAAALIRPRLAVPIHWGTFYPVGLARFVPHPLAEPPRRFAAECARIAPEVEVRVVAPGDSTPLA